MTSNLSLMAAVLPTPRSRPTANSFCTGASTATSRKSFLMNADGTNDRNLSGSASSDGWPSWSPDGRRIVFSRHTTNGIQIFVMDLDDGNLLQLTDVPGEFVNPRWSPDGSAILCGRRLAGSSLVLLDAPT
jgi:TolB protein